METQKTPCCATIGFFDGVHRGHQFVIERLRRMARESGMRSMAITFDRHPREVVHAGYTPQLITPTGEKLRLLRLTGVDSIEVLTFDADMARLSARDFMRQVLRDRLGVARLLIGYDNRFGHNRAEGFDDYVAYGREMGIDVVHNTPVDIDGLRVSSSAIRRLISGGDVAEAARCLGHAFKIEGTVVRGFQEGRRLGFPTANIQPDCKEQIMPLTGVYDVSVAIGGGSPMPAMLNIGTNPTFQRGQQTIEAHIIGFHGDIYGSHVSVEFRRRLRGERRFGSVEELKNQLERDRDEILKTRTANECRTFQV